jgi:hypothetical protein
MEKHPQATFLTPKTSADRHASNPKITIQISRSPCCIWLVYARHGRDLVGESPMWRRYPLLGVI